MDLQILEVPPSELAEYARVSIAFEVRERLTVAATDCGLPLGVEVVPTPYVKNYDAVPGNHPTDWPRRFDASQWGILVARAANTPAGGAVVIHRAPGMEMLEGRKDLAVLWDIRVVPALRGQGIGSVLFRAAEAWALARGAMWLEIETQNINAGACQFYQRHGCTLVAVNRNVYRDLPDEVQMIWQKRLESGARVG